MIAMALAACAAGLFLAFLLMLRVPPCPKQTMPSKLAVSVIVPARNEEANLPQLLQSLGHLNLALKEVLVVDDHSTDQTAEIAREHGARVLTSQPLPAGWTGKTWACAQGTEASTGELLLFLDADTWLLPHGIERMTSVSIQSAKQPVAVSLLPYHVTRAPYEELSLFFNLLMAFGAGGFGIVGTSRLFGQSLLIPRDLYRTSGGHGAVPGRILENLALADRINSAGGRCVCFGGKDVLQLRMFPEGVHQLIASWRKAFAEGAAASGGPVLMLSIVWLTALCTVFLLPIMVPPGARMPFVALYLVAALQVAWFARQVGSFRWYTALLYPIPLVFFFVLFAESLADRIFRRQVTWRGRQI